MTVVIPWPVAAPILIESLGEGNSRLRIRDTLVAMSVGTPASG